MDKLALDSNRSPGPLGFLLPSPLYRWYSPGKEEFQDAVSGIENTGCITTMKTRSTWPSNTPNKEEMVVCNNSTGEHNTQQSDRSDDW